MEHSFNRVGNAPRGGKHAGECRPRGPLGTRLNVGGLRAVGFRKKSIFSLLFWETGWVSLLSSLLGAATGIAAAYLVAPSFGIEHPGVQVLPALLGTAAGLFLGLAGAVPPARRAAALSPTEAIRSL